MYKNKIDIVSIVNGKVESARVSKLFTPLLIAVCNPKATSTK